MVDYKQPADKHQRHGLVNRSVRVHAVLQQNGHGLMQRHPPLPDTAPQVSQYRVAVSEPCDRRPQGKEPATERYPDEFDQPA